MNTAPCGGRNYHRQGIWGSQQDSLRKNFGRTLFSRGPEITAGKPVDGRPEAKRKSIPKIRDGRLQNSARRDMERLFPSAFTIDYRMEEAAGEAG
jgi:hypothetical protein